MGFLTGKNALVVGVANNRSIAYGIAHALHRQGANLAFTYQSERLQSRAEKAAEETGSSIVLPCDVSKDEEITNLFANLKKHWDHVDIIIHSVAYAPADQLAGDYVSCVTREGFQIAHDISSYSFVALAKAALPMMEGRDAALLTLTYFGAEKAVINYNVMGLAKASLEANIRYMAQSLGPKGIRVNGLSAGPVRTLAASGIGDFRKLLDDNAKMVPMRRNITLDDVGNTAAFLCSDLAAGITGEIVHVDSGFHCVGLGDRE
jgi:enoyl-[acyl-carrier protein] reductase I